MMILLLASFAILAAYDWIPLARQGLKRDLWLNAVLMLLSLAGYILTIFRIRVTSPVWESMLSALVQGL